MLAAAVLCTMYPGIDALGHSLPDDLPVSEICHLVWGEKNAYFSPKWEIVPVTTALSLQ